MGLRSKPISMWRSPIKRIARLVRNTSRYYELYGFGGLTEEALRRLKAKIWPLEVRCRAVAFAARNLLKNSAPLCLTVEGVSFCLVPKGTVAFRLWTKMGFERMELEFVLRHLRTGATFINIGSDAELFAIAAARRLEQLGGGSVHALEPCRCVFELLEENIKLNHLGNLSYCEITIGEGEGEAATTLNSYLKLHNIGLVDLMRIDVGGAELFIFEEIEWLLCRRDAPLLLYKGTFQTSRYNYHPVEIMWLLQDLGYRLFVLDTSTGQILPRKADHGYEATMIAAKCSHPSFADL